MMSPLAAWVLFGGWVKLFKREKDDDSVNLDTDVNGIGSDSRSAGMVGAEKPDHK
jgi:hypothetical protein